MAVRGALLAAALLASAGAGAAERKLSVSSFERVRVEGPFQVTVTTGRSPGATIAGDPRRLEQVEVRLDGATLVVRSPLEKWTEQAQRAGDAKPVVVTLATPKLSGASVLGGGALTIAGARTDRLDLSVAGAGGIDVTGADAEQANATIIGNGRITLAGRAGKARLLTNGAGRIDADKLYAGEVTVRVDGPGETLARARYIATVTNTGLGHVAVAGKPKCTVLNQAGGPVTCGVGAPPPR